MIKINNNQIKLNTQIPKFGHSKSSSNHSLFCFKILSHHYSNSFNPATSKINIKASNLSQALKIHSANMDFLHHSTLFLYNLNINHQN